MFALFVQLSSHFGNLTSFIAAMEPKDIKAISVLQENMDVKMSQQVFFSKHRQQLWASNMSMETGNQ